VAQLLTRPPSDFDNQLYMERMLQGMNAQDPSDMVHQNVERLKRLIEDIEQRGSRAFLIEVPFAAPIERSRSVQITKRITHESFPNPQSWLAIAAPREELRWADGVHLDERSALIVVQSLEKALRGSSEPAHGKIVTKPRVIDGLSGYGDVASRRTAPTARDWSKALILTHLCN